MNEFLTGLMEKHKGNLVIMIICSLLSALTSFVTSNQNGWLQEDIELIVEHHLEKRFNLPSGMLDTKKAAPAKAVTESMHAKHKDH